MDLCNPVKNSHFSRRTFLKATGLVGATATLTTLNWTHLTPAEKALAAPGGSKKINVMFIGAHPDDEAGTLGALGQWNEYNGATAGVITMTRGEGGGNAVGLEEGPPLGLLREAEERQAVGYAGIENIFNLDALDFYYTASAPLSAQVWGGVALLNRIVRVIRATRPEVIITMNPSAIEGNHGNHQQAAMFAVEAYLMAGDPDMFPEHMEEGFEPWQPHRIFRTGANGSGAAGPDGVAAGYTPTVASEVVYGAWNGRFSERNNARWSEMVDKARWSYVTQGWAEFAPTTTDPAQISNTWFTTIHSRTPLIDPKTGYDAALRGSFLPVEGGLPLGTLIDVKPQRFEAVPGRNVIVDVVVRAPLEEDLAAGSVSLAVPAGWSVSGAESTGALAAGKSTTVTFTVSVPGSAATGQNVRVEATLTAGGASGTTYAQLRTAGAAEATILPLEEIGAFRDWTTQHQVRHLDALVPEMLALGSGRTRKLEVVVTNYTDASDSGTVTFDVPEGFAIEPAQATYSGVSPNSTHTLVFELTNTDPSLPTANRAPNNGVYPITIHTRSDSGTHAKRNIQLNLVPVHEVVPTNAEKFKLDAQWSEEKYPGEELDISTIWDGAQPESPNDIAGSTWVTRDDKNFYLFINIIDDIRGTILPAADNKRQRRTDSVEIYFDPRGTAGNTAQTFIAGIMPSMDSMTGKPGVGRDRDAWQGEAHITAPGMEVAVDMATTESAYDGYRMEVKIPFSELPDNIDPEHVGFNILVNDSDTQNKAAQSRIGWSTFRGVRADPWRWGILTVPGVADLGAAPKEPILPDTAAQSVESPQSILQSAADRVPLGGWPPLPGEFIVTEAILDGGEVLTRIETPSSGTLRVFLWDGTRSVGSIEERVSAGEHSYRIPVLSSRALSLAALDDETLTVAASFVDGDERVAAAALRVGENLEEEPTPEPTPTDTTPAPDPGDGLPPVDPDPTPSTPGDTDPGGDQGGDPSDDPTGTPTTVPPPGGTVPPPGGSMPSTGMPALAPLAVGGAAALGAGGALLRWKRRKEQALGYEVEPTDEAASVLDEQ